MNTKNEDSKFSMTERFENLTLSLLMMKANVHKDVSFILQSKSADWRTYMFKLGDIIIWQSCWNTLFLGKVTAKFKDERGIPSLLCDCVGDDYIDRDPKYTFIAPQDACIIWMKPVSRTIEG